MANSYFQFKQFRIEQNRCAMKVCTDSCVFGASIPVEKAAFILDIGTGTGLLALMAAQRSEATIQAVEVEPEAAQQAAENFATSPWASRLHLFSGRLQDFEPVTIPAYDLIMCNPPFYLASQKSADAARNKAMHGKELPFADLLRFTKKFLSPTGSLYILLPPSEARLFTTQAASFDLYLRHQLLLYTQESGKHIRSILHLKRQPEVEQPVTSETIFIRQADQQYTAAFRQLLQPYYLIF